MQFTLKSHISIMFTKTFLPFCHMFFFLICWAQAILNPPFSNLFNSYLSLTCMIISKEPLRKASLLVSGP